MPRRFKLIVAPDEIEAMQLTPETIARAILWTNGIEVVEKDPFDNKLTFVALNIPTEREGAIRATENWWIIKHPDGHFSTMGPNEFAETYVLAGKNG